MAEGVVSVCWKGHRSELATVYKSLLENGFLVDCTLSAEGQSLKAHRLVLSACSPYFHSLFREESGERPVIILLGASFDILKAVIDFVYRGETQIVNQKLEAFLALACSLQIKGLNAVSKDFVCKAMLQSSSASKQNSCEVQGVCASPKVSPEKNSHQYVHNSKGSSGAVPTISSVVTEQGSGLCVDERSIVTPSRGLEKTCLNEEELMDSEITVKFEPLFPASYSLGSRNNVLDLVESNEPVSGNSTSITECRIDSVCGEQDLNQLSNVAEGDGPLLPTILVPKQEHSDDEEWGETMDDLDVPEEDRDEADERTEPVNRGLSSSEGGIVPENDQATQQRGERVPGPPTELHLLPSLDGSRISVRSEASMSTVASHSRPRQHRCDVCGVAFASRSALALHSRSHTGERPYRCEFCDASFAKPNVLVSHRRKHTGERPYRCEFCDASFAESSVLVTHRRKHTGERPFGCEVCGASFAKSSVLRSHRRMHTGERPFRCDACGASFAQATTLANHKRTHTGERPFACDLCGVAFTQQSSLNQHVRAHTGERAHRCEACGKAFVSKMDLVRHARTHTGERPFRCETCGDAFAQVCSLASHVRTHTGERPYRCDVCGDAFSHANTLSAHMRTHTGERPFACEVCGNAFATKRALGSHMRTHTGERPFRCDVCGKDFSHRSSFTYHKRTHARVPQ